LAHSCATTGARRRGWQNNLLLLPPHTVIRSANLWDRLFKGKESSTGQG
jgi:hypothetical protein